ncbi:hypothetical protein C6N75_21230 [Streptomyces solincola]|uniref:Uncharacterized protein n=1 Tax=Streptomyces solincola TaxID=2100817 RepID=A0A2S9PS61_9ACTN|nr:hypothetical protein C6N75_21230 [Streptomyces solincola]
MRTVPFTPSRSVRDAARRRRRSVKIPCRKPEAGSREPEAGSRKPGAGSRKPRAPGAGPGRRRYG